MLLYRLFDHFFVAGQGCEGGELCGSFSMGMRGWHLGSGLGRLIMSRYCSIFRITFVMTSDFAVAGNGAGFFF